MRRPWRRDYISSRKRDSPPLFLPDAPSWPLRISHSSFSTSPTSISCQTLLYLGLSGLTDVEGIPSLYPPHMQLEPPSPHR